MADESNNNNNKPKTEKTSASATSTLPRQCPTTKLELKDINCNIPKLKSRSVGSRPASYESHDRLGLKDHSKANCHKSKLTEFKDFDQRFPKNLSLFYISPRNYHGQIPILHRRSFNVLRMSPPVTRSPSPAKRHLTKDLKSTNKVKTITFDQGGKRKSKTTGSRSPSPVKTTPGSYKKSKQRNPSPKTGEKSTTVKRPDYKSTTSPRAISPTKRKSKAKILSSSNVEFLSKDKPEREIQRPIVPSDAVVLKQSSQPSICNKDKLIQPQEKITLDHIKNEVYSGDHRRLSFEKVHLCIEKSDENLSVTEGKQSYVVTYSSDDPQKQEGISLAILQNLSSTSITTFSNECDRKRLSDSRENSESKSAIRTLSGHELILTPSIKLDIDNTECDDIEISELLHESGENFDEQKEVHIFQDDANEYDSEMSTDGEIPGKNQKKQMSASRISGSKSNDLSRKSQTSAWKNRESEMLNDVDYRQSVYHPAVSRRQKDENTIEFRPKSKSIEDNFGYSNKTTIVRSRSSNLKNKYTSQSLIPEKSKHRNIERSWDSTVGHSSGKDNYPSVIQSDPLYNSLEDIKRSRTKKERISGALLRFTLKTIRLLALFNAWPGDNCYMLTSQSLRIAG